MNVLLISPERIDTFWSLKQSCKSLGKKTPAPPLGLITVAALLPKEWECRLVDLNARQLTDEDWRWTDLVMFSALVAQKESLLKMIREAKRRGKTVAAGGPYPTSLPQEVLDAGADFLVRGEAEGIMPSLLSALREGSKGGVFEEDLKPDLSLSPMPRFDLLHLDDYVSIGIQTSRGCPFNCEFCDVVNLNGRKPRHKSPHQVIAELDALYRLGWRGEVFICDDNFIGYRGHTLAILDLLIPWMKGHGEPFCFMTQASVNLGQDIELIDLLTAANFGHVLIGVESSDEEVLAANRKYQNIKNPLGQSLSNICANGLTVMATFMIGFDKEKKGVHERMCAFVEEHHIPMVMLNIVQALPNTNLWDRLEKEGRLIPQRTSGDTQEMHLNYIPSRPAAEILGEYVSALDRLYEPSRYMERSYRHFLAMRPTRRALGHQDPVVPGPEASNGRSSETGVSLPELSALLQMIWKRGITSSYRLQFWKQLIDIYRKNPSRMRKYLACLGFGENMYLMRESLLRKAARTGIDAAGQASE